VASIGGVRPFLLLCWVLLLASACTTPAVPDAAPAVASLAPSAIGQGSTSATLPRMFQRTLQPGGMVAWTEQELRAIRSLSIAELPALPPDPSNRIADDSRAIELGRLIFFDTRFSVNRKISCATCHRPDLAFTDGLAKARGIGQTRRNTPGLIGVAWQTWFLWDGRRDSLWAQAVTPLEAPQEMGISRVEVVRTIASDADYRKRYEQLFGALPIETLDAEFPHRAGPFGDAAAATQWRSLADGIRRRINIAFANVGKSIAAFERTLAPAPGRFDRYAETLAKGGFGADSQLLDTDEVAGLRLFIDIDKTRCLNCHNGPLFTNHDFHNTGTGVRGSAGVDWGRIAGIADVWQDEFNCLGEYSDAARAACTALRFMPGSGQRHDVGAFKVPSLRNLSVTGPYMHDGRFATLEAVLEHYRSPAELNLALHELTPLDLTDTELKQLARFLHTLTERRFGPEERRMGKTSAGK